MVKCLRQKPGKYEVFASAFEHHFSLRRCVFNQKGIDDASAEIAASVAVALVGFDCAYMVTDVARRRG
jgi:hypothetical protein